VVLVGGVLIGLAGQQWDVHGAESQLELESQLEFAFAGVAKASRAATAAAASAPPTERTTRIGFGRMALLL
jgi:hypothetical protein